MGAKPSKVLFDVNYHYAKLSNILFGENYQWEFISMLPFEDISLRICEIIVIS
jgi:hypothetical protein